MRSLLFGLGLAAAPAAAQTCAGTFHLPLAVEISAPTGGTRAVPMAANGMFRVSVVRVVRRRAAPPGAPRLPPDSMEARPAEFRVRRDTLQLHGTFLPREEIAVRTECGYELLRFEITRENGGRAMVLDVYGVPAHVPYRLAGPLRVRPGAHLRLDMRAHPRAELVHGQGGAMRLIPLRWVEEAAPAPAGG